MIIFFKNGNIDANLALLHSFFAFVVCFFSSYSCGLVKPLSIICRKCKKPLKLFEAGPS